jgi:hypothetical protein
MEHGRTSHNIYEISHSHNVAGYRTSETVQAVTPHKNIGTIVSKN